MTANAPRRQADVDHRSVSEEDRLRARVYGLVARLLAAPLDDATLGELARLHGDESDLGRPLSALSMAARTASREAFRDEFHTLFIGVGRGELLPYASYYLTGFLNEKPLARLRVRMRALGIERDPAVSEPEDHMAALCDMMAGLILGRFGPPADLTIQKEFFEAHLADWGPYFFADLEKAEAARLYAPVGALGRAFLAVEADAFAMVD